MNRGRPETGRTGAGERVVGESGARRFDQLDVSAAGGAVTVAFDHTLVMIRGVSIDEIGAEDFRFWTSGFVAML